jgi:hypothetical protein
MSGLLKELKKSQRNNWKDFPLVELYEYLSYKIKDLNITRKTYDPYTFPDDPYTIPNETLYEKLTVDASLGWDTDLVINAIGDFIEIDLLKNNKLIELLSFDDEEYFKNTIAKWFKQFIYRSKKYRSSEERRLRNKMLEILDSSLEFKMFQKHKKRNLEKWGLSSWSKKRETINKEKVSELKLTLPFSSDLKVRPNPNAKKASPVIFASDLKPLIINVIDEADGILLFEDLLYIIMYLLNLAELEIIQGSKEIYSHTDLNKTVTMSLIENLPDKDIDYNSFDDTSLEDKWNKKIIDYIDALSTRDKNILHGYLLENLESKDIEQKYGIPLNTQKYRLKILKPVLKKMSNNDNDVLKKIVSVIKKYLSKDRRLSIN